MNRQEISTKIEQNLKAAGMSIKELRIQEDPFSGWRILVVSPEFVGMHQKTRHEIVLNGLKTTMFQWVELLTPKELEWAGDLPINVDLEQLPLWPEAMARSRVNLSEPVVFASDLDEDLDRPIIATFYSLRGGVGRSTALAYTARLIASRGHSVLCIDMDLEAPGLVALFGKEAEVGEETGLVSILAAFDQEEEPDILEHIIRISDSDELYCLPAGIPSANYARRLRMLDPEAWYRQERNPLHTLFDSIAKRLPFVPDIVLVDARTGITPLSAPLLFDLSDLAIITFFPHPQAYKGTATLVQAIINAKSRREFDSQRLTPEPRFLVSPIPTDKASEQRYRLRATDWISGWLSSLYSSRTKEAPPIEVGDVTHFVHYREVIATSDRILSDEEVWRYYQPIADWLERFIPTRSERAPLRLAENKQTILEGLTFSAGTAESQETIKDSFVKTEIFDKAMSLDKLLVLGRKGTGKTAVFRWLWETWKETALVVLAPAALRTDLPWVISPDGFKAIEDKLDESKVGWREFWVAYTALACFLSLTQQGKVPPFPQEPLRSSVEELIKHKFTELKVTQCLVQLISTPEVGLLAWDWLQALRDSLNTDAVLLFDGLDTGFGTTTVKERERRTRAIEGLFSFVTDRISEMSPLHFKILLREDIWRSLRFENKSHLFGRSVRLEWRNRVDYAKTVLKQALHNRDFVKFVNPLDKDLESWPDDEVFRVWNILVGERMKGGKTAFTLNWVWNRLADGNGDHGPRALLQLFREATAWEKEENKKSAYDRSIIRPRALIISLDRVSEEALDALSEEFVELKGLISQLQALGRSPVEARELKSFDEQLKLATDVGLIEVYERTEEEVQRYRIPDLYRIALGMTRRGQA